jgi:hypothetical protein
VRPANGLPLRDIRYEDAGPDYVLEACASLVQRIFDDFDAAPCLTVGIANGKHLAVLPN